MAKSHASLELQSLSSSAATLPGEVVKSFATSTIYTVPACTIGQEYSTWIHPNGWQYFQYKLQGNSIITHVDPRLKMHGEKTLEPYVRKLEPFPDENYEIGLSEGKDGTLRGVIYVNHSLRLASEEIARVTEAHTLGSDSYDEHIEYWTFMIQHPAHSPLPKGTLSAAKQLLKLYIMDGLRRRTESHSPFSLEQTKQML